MGRLRLLLEIVCLLLLIGASITFRFFFFAGPRRIAIIPDEVLYYDVARNIFNGAGLAFRGYHSLFQKCLYSVVLAPFFQIADGANRVHAILLFNSAALSSSAVFSWLIVRRLGLPAPLRLLCVAMLLLFPDMIFAGTFMAENIYWPIFFCTVWLWLENEITHRIWRTILLALSCCAGYLAKEAFSALIIAMIAMGAVRAIRAALGKEEPGRQSRFAPVWHFAVFCLVLAVAHVFFQRFVFAGMTGYGQFSMSHFSTWPKIRHILFGWVLNLAGCGLEVLFLPLLAPLALWRRVECRTMRLYWLAVITLLCLSGGVAVSIVPLENIPVPRLHLRYAGPVLALLTAICLLALSKADDASVMKIAVPFIALVGASLLVLHSWPPLGSAVDNFIHRTVSVIILNSAPWEKTIAFLPLAIVAFAFWRCFRLVGTAVWVTSLLFLFAIVQREDGRFVKMLWAEKPQNVLEAKRMNQWFLDHTQENAKILFLPKRLGSGGAYLFDVYFDKWATISFANQDDVTAAANLNKSVDCQWNGGRWAASSVVLPRIDYLILENVPPRHQRILPIHSTYVKEASGNIFSVFENQDPLSVPFVKAMVFDGAPMKIRFTPKTKDAYSQMIKCKLQEGDAHGVLLPNADVPFKCPMACDATNVVVSMAVHSAEKAKLEVLGMHSETIWDGTISGDSHADFNLAVRHGFLRFVIRKEEGRDVRIREISLKKAGE